MSIRVDLRGMLRLIRVDTLRRVHNVGFLTGRVIWENVDGTVIDCLGFNAVFNNF